MTAISARPAAAPAARSGPRPGTRTVYVWELRKLRAQKRTFLGLGAALLGLGYAYRRFGLESKAQG